MKNLFLTVSKDAYCGEDLISKFSIYMTVESLKDKYKNQFDITDNLTSVFNTAKSREDVITGLSQISASVFDGLVLPLNYKKYNDLINLKNIAIKSNKPIYLFDEDKLQIIREDVFNGSAKVTETNNHKCSPNTGCCTSNKGSENIQPKAKSSISPTNQYTVKQNSVYEIVDGDAEITYSERNGQKSITVYHQGKATKYLL